jgi:D-sedoheptulose 7-phosphate isomerase
MTIKMDIIRNDFLEAKKLLDEFIIDEKNFQKIEEAGVLMIEAIHSGNKIISCGNGGSMSDAMHFAEELTGRYKDTRRGLPAISISDPSHLSCVANDFGYEFVFSRFIGALGKKGDVLLAISTSGNSANIINAANTARKLGIHVVSLSGKNGGKLAALCDVEIRVPFKGFSDRIQEIHIKVIHSLINYIEKNLDLYPDKNHSGI